MRIPHSINCTPRDSALYAKATKRTIPVESLRGDWILDISNRILIVRFFKYRMLDGISSVCGNEGFFRFGIGRWETRDFFVVELFFFCSFEDLLWKIYSKSFLFFCLCGKWIFFFFLLVSVGEKSCIEIYGIFLSCFWIMVLYNPFLFVFWKRNIIIFFFFVG